MISKVFGFLAIVFGGTAMIRVIAYAFGEMKSLVRETSEWNRELEREDPWNSPEYLEVEEANA